MKKYSLLIITAYTLVLFSNQSLAADLQDLNPTGAPPKYQSNFDRAMEQAGKNAGKAPPYTPPDPHKGRYKIKNTDYSVGGKIDPPSINVRTTTK